MWFGRYKLYWVTRRHVHQRVEEPKHSEIGKHLKEEHSVRPSNLCENFTILKKCRSKLGAYSFKFYTFERKDRNWTLKRTLFARNFLFNTRWSCFMTDIMYFFFTLLFLYSLHPFWNRWLSLQSDWLSAVRFIPKSHYFLFQIASLSQSMRMRQ